MFLRVSRAQEGDCFQHTGILSTADINVPNRSAVAGESNTRRTPGAATLLIVAAMFGGALGWYRQYIW